MTDMAIAEKPSGLLSFTAATCGDGHMRRRRAVLLAEVAADHQLPIDTVEFIDSLVREDRGDEILARNPVEERALNAVVVDLRWHHRPGGMLGPRPRAGGLR